MTPTAPSPDQAAAASDHAAVVDRDTLDDLEDLFGREKLVAMLESLRREIDERLDAIPEDHGQLGRDAHALVSVTGVLGFMSLSRACAELEQACLAEGDVSGTLRTVLRAAADAQRAIAAFQANLRWIPTKPALP